MISNTAIGHEKTTYSSVLLPEPAVRSRSHNASGVRAIRKAYVCHESTTATLLISNLLICCSQRTILRFLYGAPSRRCGGSLKDQEETANVGHPSGIGRLQFQFQSRSIRVEKGGIQTFDLVHFVY